MPAHIYANWNLRASDMGRQIEPYRRYFFICEGSNTEVWYFRHLIDIRKQLGIHPLVDIRLMEKTGRDRTASNPKSLLAFAEKQKKVPANGFDMNHDRMVIVFDADIYQYEEDRYLGILQGNNGNILAVTYPSFELFLLLHLPDSYVKWIEPNRKKILANRKVAPNKRYAAGLFTRACGMNSKGNARIGRLAGNVLLAIEQEEKYLNRDINNAVGRLTSNVGQVIQNIREDSLP